MKGIDRRSFIKTGLAFGAASLWGDPLFRSFGRTGAALAAGPPIWRRSGGRTPSSTPSGRWRPSATWITCTSASPT